MALAECHLCTGKRTWKSWDSVNVETLLQQPKKGLWFLQLMPTISYKNSWATEKINCSALSSLRQQVQVPDGQVHTLERESSLKMCSSSSCSLNLSLPLRRRIHLASADASGWGTTNLVVEMLKTMQNDSSAAPVRNCHWQRLEWCEKMGSRQEAHNSNQEEQVISSSSSLSVS